jgi:hypothetical protein
MLGRTRCLLSRFYVGVISLLKALDKIGFRRRAHRVKPATDVYLSMRFTAVMAGSSRIGGFRIPPVHREVGVSTSNQGRRDSERRPVLLARKLLISQVATIAKIA